MAIPSFPEVHVTGPVHHFIRASRGDDAIYFLGTCEVTPQMARRKYKSDVKNTIAGQSLPFQRAYDGEAAKISVLLNRFSYPAMFEIAGSDSSIGNTIVPGMESRWSRGHLVFGQSDFELWQIFDNFFNPLKATLDPTLPIGFYWPQVELLDDNTVSVGTLDEKRLLVLDATPWWIPQASPTNVNATLNERGWMLYSQDATASIPGFGTPCFPAEVRVPQ